MLSGDIAWTPTVCSVPGRRCVTNPDQVFREKGARHNKPTKANTTPSFNTEDKRRLGIWAFAFVKSSLLVLLGGELGSGPEGGRAGPGASSVRKPLQAPSAAQGESREPGGQRRGGSDPAHLAPPTPRAPPPPHAGASATTRPGARAEPGQGRAPGRRQVQPRALRGVRGPSRPPPAPSRTRPPALPGGDHGQDSFSGGQRCGAWAPWEPGPPRGKASTRGPLPARAAGSRRPARPGPGRSARNSAPVPGSLSGRNSPHPDPSCPASRPRARQPGGGAFELGGGANAELHLGELQFPASPWAGAWRLLGERVSFARPQLRGDCHWSGAAAKLKSPSNDVVKSPPVPATPGGSRLRRRQLSCCSEAAAALEASPGGDAGGGRRAPGHSCE